MTASPPPSAPPEADRDELDALVMAFERARLADPGAPVADFLPPSGHPLHTEVLVELVRVDMELAWGRGLRKTAGDYLPLFPRLGEDPEAARAVAFEESRLRLLAAGPGDGPPPSGLDPAAPAPRPDDEDGASEAAGAMPAAGSRLLGFTVERELGRGAFGRVFLARQGDLADRPVVLKVSADVFDESQSMAQLQHTNIVPVYSVHRRPPFQVICMPYLGSATLADVLADVREAGALPGSGSTLVEALSSRRDGGKAGPGPPAGGAGSGPKPPAPAAGALAALGGMTYVEAVLWVGSRAAAGLAHAHERGVLHRDLKPANVLLADDGQPLLLDFNLAADLKREARPGAASAVGGTLPYMAPEHLEAFRSGAGGGAVDARADLYSLGVVLFELLTGRLPFEAPRGAGGPDLPAMIAGRLRGAPPRARAWNKDVTPAVDSILSRCLAGDPSRRYPDAPSLREDLERQLSGRPLRHAPDPSPRERAGKFVRRHPALCGSTSIALMSICAIAFASALAWRASESSASDRARARADDFRAAFDRCQLLLNAEGPPGRLRGGLALALRALDGYGVFGPEDWRLGPLVRGLPEARRLAIRSEAAELVMLAARAKVALAPRDGPEAREAREAAVSWLGLAERSDPRPPAALFEERARLLDGLGRRAEAGADRARASAVAPETARDFALLGQARLAWGRPDAAEPLLSRAAALDPRRFWSWFLLGVCHADQGRPSDAAADFAVSAALAPDFSWPHHNRGLALARAGRLAEALACYDRALAVDPDFGEALVNRGLASLQLGDPASASRDFDRAASLGSPAPLARAEALARLGLRGRAEAAFASAIAGAPADPRPVAVRGVCRVSYDRDGAAADFRRALAIDPRCAPARLGLAYLLRRDDPRAALAEADRALDLDPASADALELRALLRARLGLAPAESDVDRLLLAPTPRRLYNASCALSLLSRPAPPADAARLRSRALDLLGRAVEAGWPRPGLADDPDLGPLRDSPRFAALSRAGGR